MTCGRPDALFQACRSYLTNAYDFGHRPTMLVIDDAESPHPWQRSVGAVTRSAAERSAPLWYGGRQERRHFAAALIEGGQLPGDVVHFALFGSGTGGETIGATRNLLLLATQGTLILSADDDTCCRAFLQQEGISRGLRFGAHRDYGEVTFCVDRAAALRQGMPITLDVIGEHQRYLGKSLGELIAAEPWEAVDLEQMCPHLWSALCDRQGQISLTLNGLIGDAGLYTNLWVLLCQDRASRLRLSTRDALAHAMESREIARQVRVPTVTHVLPFVSTFFGLDHRRLLPPFLPEHRNDEGVFADVFARCFGHRYACHLPWMLEHLPMEPRRYASETIAQVRVSDVIKACMGSWSSPACGRDAAVALSSLGRHIVDLATLSLMDFVEVLRQLLWQRASELASALEAQYRRSMEDGFEFWAEELSTQRRVFESALVDPTYCVPVDLTGPADFDARMAMTQALVRRYGELLQWWPAMCERARLLEAEGRGPAIRIV